MSEFAQRYTNVLSRNSSHDPVIEQILSFENLEDGWHFGEGRCPSRREIVSAMSIVSHFRSAGARAVEVFPAPDGGILVAGYGKNVLDSIELLCRSDGSFDFWLEINGEEEAAHENLDLSDLMKMVEEYRWCPKLSFGFFTRYTTAESEPGTKAPLFKTRQASVEFPSLMSIVHPRKVAQSAPI